MKTLKVSLKTILSAMRRAGEVSDDWQAECLEILRVPAIAKRWRELNPRFGGLSIVRHDGAPHVGMTREDNMAVSDWTRYAGYTLVYDRLPDGSCWGWNSVRTDYYGHSPSSTWNGCGRETICRFVEDLRMIALGHDHPECRKSLRNAQIDLVSRVAVPA